MNGVHVGVSDHLAVVNIYLDVAVLDLRLVVKKRLEQPPYDRAGGGQADLCPVQHDALSEVPEREVGGVSRHYLLVLPGVGVDAVHLGDVHNLPAFEPQLQEEAFP